jgi:hypothetical protein
MREPDATCDYPSKEAAVSRSATSPLLAGCSEFAWGLAMEKMTDAQLASRYGQGFFCPEYGRCQGSNLRVLCLATQARNRLAV